MDVSAAVVERAGKFCMRVVDHAKEASGCLGGKDEGEGGGVGNIVSHVVLKLRSDIFVFMIC